MDKIIIRGGERLIGEVEVSGTQLAYFADKGLIIGIMHNFDPYLANST